MVYDLLWMRSHLNTSFTHSDKRKGKKISCFNLLCPQLLLVNRSAVSFLEDDLPQNRGGEVLLLNREVAAAANTTLKVAEKSGSISK